MNTNDCLKKNLFQIEGKSIKYINWKPRSFLILIGEVKVAR